VEGQTCTNRTLGSSAPVHHQVGARDETRSRAQQEDGRARRLFGSRHVAPWILSQAIVREIKLILLDVLDAYAGDWALLPALVAGLRRATREVVLRLPLDHTDFGRVLAAGARTVGGDLRGHAWPHARAMRGLADFGKAARSAGLKCYVLGINTQPLAIAAIAAGFDYLAGNAVSPEIPEPVGVVPLDAAHVSRGASANRSLKR
jgi:hypothetical protein